MSTGTLPAAVRPWQDVLAWSRRQVEPALREAVTGMRPAIRRIAGYHFGWYHADGSPRGAAAAGGKAIRPALALLSAEVTGSGAAGAGATAALPAAVAVELVHNFSLIQDDVIDGDLTRRHQPAVWTVFGPGAAIVVGDALLTLAVDLLAGYGHPAAPAATRILDAAVAEMLDGELADLALEDRTDVDLAECLRMAAGKTGALVAGACALGGSFGCASPAQLLGLREFGAKLGLAFQLVDDLLGIWGDPGRTGKPVHGDLRRRKKSLPVVAALTSGTAAGAELAGFYHPGHLNHPDRADTPDRTDTPDLPAHPDRVDAPDLPAHPDRVDAPDLPDAPPSEAELARAAALVEQAGGRDWARKRASELLAEALQALRSATGPTAAASRAGAELAAVARLAVHRDQ